ncbi:MAG: thioredoxin [Bacilli bacterium]|nr:thioredoxin [Bacilli bacterium]
MEVIKIKEEEFEEKVLKSDKKVLVDFYADWCGPCKMLAPVIDKLAEEVDDVSFVKINVDNAENVARSYGVMSIPALFVFENGEVVKNSVGFQSIDELKEFIEV